MWVSHEIGVICAILTALVDYNSWIDTPKSQKLLKTLDKDVVLAEGKRVAIYIGLAAHANAFF